MRNARIFPLKFSILYPSSLFIVYTKSSKALNTYSNPLRKIPHVPLYSIFMLFLQLFASWTFSFKIKCREISRVFLIVLQIYGGKEIWKYHMIASFCNQRKIGAESRCSSSQNPRKPRIKENEWNNYYDGKGWNFIEPPFICNYVKYSVHFE